MTFLVTKYKQVVTPESAEIGDYDRTETVFENDVMTVREILEELQGDAWEASTSHARHFTGHEWATTIYPEHDRAYFEKGEEATYSLHIADATPHQLRRLFKAGGVLCNYDPPGHDWKTSPLGGNVTCARCGLLPLDQEDIDSPCEG